MLVIDWTANNKTKLLTLSEESNYPFLTILPIIVLLAWPHSPSGFKDLVDEFCSACDGLLVSLKVSGSFFVKRITNLIGKTQAFKKIVAMPKGLHFGWIPENYTFFRQMWTALNMKVWLVGWSSSHSFWL